jgi:hypothetical protein
VAYVFSVFCNHAGVLHCHFHFLSLTYLPWHNCQCSGSI